jgi:hypothetical protein
MQTPSHSAQAIQEKLDISQENIKNNEGDRPVNEKANQ